MTLFLISLRHLSVPPDRTPLSDTSHAFIHFLAAFGVAKQRSGVPPGGNPEIVPDTVRGNMAKVGRLIRVAFDFFSTIVLEFGTYIFFRHSACDKMFSDEDNCSLPLSKLDIADTADKEFSSHVEDTVNANKTGDDVVDPIELVRQEHGDLYAEALERYGQDNSIDPEDEKRLKRKLDRRIIPLLGICYFFYVSIWNSQFSRGKRC